MANRNKAVNQNRNKVVNPAAHLAAKVKNAIVDEHKGKKKMDGLSKAVLVLLIFALIGIIVVGSLFTTVQGKQGEQGEQGDKGAPGQPLPPLTGFLSQVNPSLFTVTASQVQQFTSVAIITVSLTLNQSLAAFSTSVVGVVQGIGQVIQTSTTTAFMTNSTNQSLLTWNKDDSSLVLGPLPQIWPSGNIVNFTMVANAT